MKETFKIGDRVVGVDNSYYDIKGVAGVVVHVDFDVDCMAVIVSFDEQVYGSWKHYNGDNAYENCIYTHVSRIAHTQQTSTKLLNKIIFAKTKPNAIIPSKREEDGAFDIYACFEEDYITIEPNKTKLIPTGLASAFSSDYVAILKERGSTGTKGMGQRAGVVDSGYRGEWFVPITNHNDKQIVIVKNDVTLLDSVVEESIVYPYEKGIAQVIMIEVPKLSVVEVDLKELDNYKSERGTGALGSSGK